MLHTEFKEVPIAPGVGFGDERWSLVLRIANSRYFCRSKKLREFLLYVSSRSLENASDDLKEQSIGCNVYGRRPDYNPAEDNIVRVQAGLLRKKLAEYFAAEGLAERIILTIPKGSYVPAFTPREADVASSDLPKVPEGMAPSGSLPLIKKPSIMESLRAWRILSGLLLLVCCLLAAGLALNHTKRVTAPYVPASLSPLWKHLIDENHRTYVVCADAGLAIFQDLTHARVSLRDYANHDYNVISGRDSQAFALGQLLIERQYTGIADAYVLQGVLSLAGGLADHTSARSARTLSVEDFKNGHFIMVGSPRSNPWVELFEPQLNFVWDYDRNGRALIRNKHPQKTEQSSYFADPQSYDAAKTYSIVAFLPNLNHTGNVLILAGMSSIGTKAAWEFATTNEAFRTFLDKRANGRLSYFELLLESSALAGEPKSTKLVGYRILGDQ